MKFGNRIQPAYYVKTDSDDAKLFLEYLKEQRELADKRNEIHIQSLRKINEDFKRESESRKILDIQLAAKRDTDYAEGIKSIIDNLQRYSKARHDEMIAHLDANARIIDENSKVIAALGQTINSLEESKDNFAILAEENTRTSRKVLEIFDQKKQFQFFLAPITMVAGVVLGFIAAVIALME